MTPHLIHIGYPKTASNFLRAWFETHPQIAFIHGGIAGYSNVQSIWRLPQEDAQPPRLRVTSSEVLVAPQTNTGPGVRHDPERRGAMPAEQALVCGRLKECFPNAHILIVTRGFRGMILSSYSQYVRTGGDLDMETLIANAQQSNAWHYDRLIGIYREAFGDDRVMVLPWEMLRDGPGDFAGAIERRFGLGAGPLPVQRFNTSLDPYELRWYPRLARAISRSPVARQRLLRIYAKAAFANRLSRPIKLLQRLRPAEPVTAAPLTDEVLELFRGQADVLAGDPRFDPYRNDYLL
ncbi:MAG TPA: hypothetical protein VEZ70_09715 [Allosphingosinicella sp.]|nr:hypothetical protein [Allosphingosinicella sp.]